MQTQLSLAFLFTLAVAAHAAGNSQRPWDETAPPAEVLKKAESAPAAADAARCLRSVIRRARGEDAVKLESRAYDLLLKHHPQSPELAQVVRRLEHGDRAFAVPQLQRILASPASDEVLGAALISLARVQMSEPLPPGAGLGPAREAGITKLLETAASKHGAAPYQAGTVASEAGRVQYELAHLMQGKLAPDIVGKDLDGKPMRLSEFRGQVVMLSFWGDW